MVQRINEQLLRKRAEHNEGELSSLREITLHQFDIERIENLDVYCRHLQILYLQNNIISKLENLNKLKELEYLNLALNNIQKLENLEGCESLRKLDLTVNFISNLLDVESLKGNYMLRELFLMGNPCTQVEGYREFVITTLPQLRFLDGREIEKSERILAAQVYDSIRARLIDMQNNPPVVAPAQSENKKTDADDVDMSEEEDKSLDKIKQDFKTKPVPHTPQTRLDAAKDVDIMNHGAHPKHGRPIPSSSTPTNPPPPLVSSDGRILQKNQGKWVYKFTETPEALILQVEISKFLDTSLIQVEVFSTWIRVTIKGKVLQLVLDEEVLCAEDDVVCERSQLTGHLAVTMIKVKKEKVLVKGLNAVAERVEDTKKNAIDIVNAWKHDNSKKANVVQTLIPKGNNKRYERLLGTATPNFPTMKELGDGCGITEARMIRTDFEQVEDFIDDPDVPPLC